ncbi:hypothetical protein HID58_043982 [Brassica napus]|uniref:Uncharacterized protein n=1 Tax=Brassica napus TaxID=3708 RepID=A0ABQ8BI20_BRANA|nr:hypothetical protein HID58_043982 [Brassica napus]
MRFGYSRRSVYGFRNLSSATTCTIFKQRSSHSVFARNGQAGGRNYLQNYCMDELCASSSIIRYDELCFSSSWFKPLSSRATESMLQKHSEFTTGTRKYESGFSKESYEVGHGYGLLF